MLARERTNQGAGTKVMRLRRCCDCAASASERARRAAQDQAARPVRARTLAEDLQLFSQVMNQIRVNHPDSVDSHAILMSAIEGLVRAVDPHSYVIPSVRFDSSRQRALEEGKLAPVPIAFTYIGRVPSVVSIGPGTNAAKQDIAVGDELIAIDGSPVRRGVGGRVDADARREEGEHGDAAVRSPAARWIDGHARTRGEARVRRRDDARFRSRSMLDATTGYVRITTFNNDKVDEDMRDALARLEREGMRRLILDLRDNGGGLVDEASNVAGEFLPRGLTVYTTEGRRESLRKVYKVPRSFWRRERSFPLVVLVNRGTASASELLAGALQDHDRALIVGRPTFGKALLMQGVPLSDGSMMMLVIGRARTPCGRIVQRQYRGVREAGLLPGRVCGARYDRASVLQDARGAHPLRRGRDLSGHRSRPANADAGMARAPERARAAHQVGRGVRRPRPRRRPARRVAISTTASSEGGDRGFPNLRARERRGARRGSGRRRAPAA